MADAGDVEDQVVPQPDVPGMSLTVQVAPDDCTGCGLCVIACPAHDKSEVKRKSINLRPIEEHIDEERIAWDAFLRVHESAYGPEVGPGLGQDEPAAPTLVRVQWSVLRMR